MASLLEALPDEILLKILKEFAENPENDIFFPEQWTISDGVKSGPPMIPDTRNCRWEWDQNYDDMQRNYASKFASLAQWMKIPAIRRVMFLEGSAHSGLLSLRQRLRHFENSDDSASERKNNTLKACTLIYGFFLESNWHMPLKGAIAKSTTDMEREQEQLVAESEISALLRDVGCPGDIEIKLAFVPSLYFDRTHRQWYLDKLREAGIPRLRVEAQALKRQAEAAVSDGDRDGQGELQVWS
ncbi:hypothetical protein PG988_015434 [Apiospora saccharicola]